MKKVLILGLGGTGSNVANSFWGINKQDKNISFLAIDTDIEALSNISHIPTLCLTEYNSLGNVVKKLDPKSISDWFPCDDSQNKVEYFKTLEMGRGANGWRMKGLLSFEYMLSDTEKRTALLNALDSLVCQDDTDNAIEIVVVSSTVGGTGSALFMPVAMYAQRYFRSRYNRDVTITALLSCPDVYIDSLTAENKIKAYANAYASFAELNAVDLVSKGYNEQAKAESKCRVGLKIGSEKSKGIGVLFDASNPAFAQRSAQPFERVYLFDKIPSVDTITAHERIMAKIVGIILDDPDKNDSSEIYAGISVAEIVFPSESIVNYVAKRKVFDDMQRECLALYNTALRQETIVSSGDSTYDFAKKYTETYKSLYTQSTYNQHLALDREEESEFTLDEDCIEPIISTEYVKEYVKSLTDDYYSLFEGEQAKAINDALLNVDKDVAPIKLFDSKSTKRQKLQVVVDKAVSYNEMLVEFLKAATNVVKDNKIKKRESLLDKNNPMSLFNKLVTYNSKYLHPVTALLLLSDAYIQVKSHISKRDDASSVYTTVFSEEELPDAIFKLASLSNDVMPEYANLGATRLKTLANADVDALSGKLVSAFDDVKGDFGAIYRSLKGKGVECFCEQALMAISGLIKKYRSILDSIPSMLDDHRVDVQLALIENTADTCVLMNVGCSEETKKQAYATYVKENKNNFARDEYTGEIFWQYAFANDRDNMFDDLVAQEKEEVLHGQAVKKACEHNIFRVLHDRDLFTNNLSQKTSYNDYKRAFSLAALPIDLAIRDEITKEMPITETVTRVPVEGAEFAREMLNDADLTLQQAVDKFLFIQGSFETNITVSSNVPKNKIFTTQKVYGFRPHFFNKLNESNVNSVYYKNYQKALSVKREQYSQMWYPHLVRETTGNFLPFIDPVKRNAFESNVYKAVLYMLQSGILLVEKDESNHDAFYLLQGDQRNEVVCENKRVLLKNPELLFGFVRENVHVAEEYGEAFDRELRKQIALLPAISFEKTHLPVYKQAILNSKTIRFLRTDMFASVRSVTDLKCKNIVDFIFDISEKESSVTDAINLGKIVATIIREFVHSRPLSDAEVYESLYAEIIEDLQTEYERNAKKAGQRLYLKKSEKAFALINSK